MAALNCLHSLKQLPPAASQELFPFLLLGLCPLFLPQHRLQDCTLQAGRVGPQQTPGGEPCHHSPTHSSEGRQKSVPQAAPCHVRTSNRNSICVLSRGRNWDLGRFLPVTQGSVENGEQNAGAFQPSAAASSRALPWPVSRVRTKARGLRLLRVWWRMRTELSLPAILLPTPPCPHRPALYCPLTATKIC